jgi:hypothetical protein
MADRVGVDREAGAKQTGGIATLKETAGLYMDAAGSGLTTWAGPFGGWTKEWTNLT